MAQNKRIGWKSTRETAWFICKDFDTIKAQLKHWVLAPRRRDLKKTHVVTREALTSWLPLSTDKRMTCWCFFQKGKRPLFFSCCCCMFIYFETGSMKAWLASDSLYSSTWLWASDHCQRFARPSVTAVCHHVWVSWPVLFCFKETSRAFAALLLHGTQQILHWTFLLPDW